MVFRVAQSLARTAAAIVLAGSGFAAGSASAQEGAAAPDAPATLERSLSPECRAPGTQLYTLAPLKTLRAALRERRGVKVLTIGSSSTFGIGASSPVATCPARLEGELESRIPRIDLEVINRGVSGEVAADTAERL